MDKDFRDKYVNKIHCADCLELMKDWPDGVIDCCVTSPPYWGLRDYGVEGQLGLEKTPEEYVAKMVAVFGEVKRVLKPEGTLWLNLGDSYFHSQRNDRNGLSTGLVKRNDKFNREGVSKKYNHDTIKEKDLCGIPWMVAFALRADGWYLRQDIIWHKPNPMPESVTDRCTKAHEYIFLLSKNKKYYYDNEAIREEAKPENMGKMSAPKLGKHRMSDPYSQQNVKQYDEIKGANKRSVWTVTTKPYSEAHFATFPPDLIEPCILAGCPKSGIVFDPFMGSGTVAEVAIKHGRDYIGCELNPEYIGLGRVKAAETGVPVKEQKIGQMAMFSERNHDED